ncbi:MAG: plastocyanin/azurin family copper-binding protein [Pseudomonadota bacterium]
MKTLFAISMLLFGGISDLLAAEYVVTQRNKGFEYNGKAAETLTIHVGDTIRFKNEDAFFHAIFSESASNAFKLNRITTGQSEVVKFDEPGTVDVECAIHRSMYIEVKVK